MSKKFYCEYCGIFLKNSSPQTRREHFDGKKHKQRMIEHYRQIRESTDGRRDKGKE